MKNFFLGENDRIKLLVLLCGEDDESLIKAASGTLALLSTLDVDLNELKDIELDDDERKRLNKILDENRILCEKILQVWFFFSLDDTFVLLMCFVLKNSLGEIIF